MVGEIGVLGALEIWWALHCWTLGVGAGKKLMERHDVGPWEIPFYISHRWLTDGLANGVKRSVSLGPICFPPRNSL